MSYKLSSNVTVSLPPSSDCSPRVEERNCLGMMTRGPGDELATNLRREGHSRLVKMTRSPGDEFACEEDKGYWRDICYKQIFLIFSHSGPPPPPHLEQSPQDIRHSAILSYFKSQLKTFLFSEYFN